MQSAELATAPSNGMTSSEATTHPLTVQSFGLTDRGRERATNEDQFVTATLMKALWIQQSSLEASEVHYADSRGHIFLVADGMGGAAGGEKASALAVGAIEGFLLNAVRWLFALDGSEEATALSQFKAALQNADACVCAAAAHDPSLRGMGTTVTMVYSAGSELFVAHVGDSRGYLLRGGALRRLTRDHTLVEALVAGGVLRPAEAATHPASHVITNVVGGGTPGVQADVHRMTLERGDVVLLCTDGLTGMVPDERIAAVLGGSTSPKAACEHLVRLANEAGGRDNVTVVVATYS